MQKHRKVWLLPLFVACGFVMSISSFILQYRLSGLEAEAARLEGEIRDADTRIRVLRAELAHLTTPARIKSMAAAYLPEWRAISPSDVIRILDIPANPMFGG
ncbi:MAG: hypothetical protein LBO78_02610 [Rickettsiales bacterium]|jgi:hypothetical protein|nr:hypothetical protein [Rickettsiales bacterium]